MDLIYTDAARHDIGILSGYSFDLAFGADENDFECKITLLFSKKSTNADIFVHLLNKR